MLFLRFWTFLFYFVSVNTRNKDLGKGFIKQLFSNFVRTANFSI